jgi:hypothetical protein
MANDEEHNTGLQKQIDNLTEVVESLDHKIRGNGQPGMVADLAVTKEKVEHISEAIDSLKTSVVEALQQGLEQERERVERSLKDTGKIQAITFPIVTRVVDERFEKFVREQKEERERLEREEKERASSPGSWRYFVDHYWMPILMMIIGILISSFPDILKALLDLK